MGSGPLTHHDLHLHLLILLQQLLSVQGTVDPDHPVWPNVEPARPCGVWEKAAGAATSSGSDGAPTPSLASAPAWGHPILTGDAVDHRVIDASVAIHGLHLQHRGSLQEGMVSGQTLSPPLVSTQTPPVPWHTWGASSGTEAE